MDVSRHSAAIHTDHTGPPKVHVLAYRRDQVGQGFADGSAGPGVGRGFDRLQVLSDLQRDLRHLLRRNPGTCRCGRRNRFPRSLPPSRPSAGRRQRRSGPRQRHGRTSWRLPPSPFFRSQSTASSRSPLVSVSARLQSIMPAPVFSRRSFTSVAVISAIVWSQSKKVGQAVGCSAGASGGGKTSGAGSSSAAPISAPEAASSALMPSRTAPDTRSQ